MAVFSNEWGEVAPKPYFHVVSSVASGQNKGWAASACLYTFIGMLSACSWLKGLVAAGKDHATVVGMR
jgi:hypothetical protein